MTSDTSIPMRRLQVARSIIGFLAALAIEIAAPSQAGSSAG